MRNRSRTSRGMLSVVIASVVLMPVSAAGQRSAATAKAAKTWTPPRTPDGQPDLQGMLPAGYNNAYKIVQTPDYVVILHEMIHEARIIPLDGRPHPASSIRMWTGDPRGRWDGNTLVVETTNFNGKGWIATNAAAGRIR